jgi:NCAIR mutase (PurE)-related protein
MRDAAASQADADGAPPDLVADLGFARLDLDRVRRTGDPEVVLASHKKPEQTMLALRRLASAHPDRAVLATRCDDATLELCARQLPGAVTDDVGRTVVVGPVPTPSGEVAVVTAGTSDLPVAREAETTIKVFGARARVYPDVGVAGLHRLMAELNDIRRADAVVVVAGADGALPSVLGGLVAIPLIAVPTSVGCGTGIDGVAALLTMLNACAPGVTVVNIDSGFGAGVAAARIARRIRGPGA